MRNAIFKITKLAIMASMVLLSNLIIIDTQRSSVLAQTTNVPSANALWVDCQTIFLNGPGQGGVQDISFHIFADGTMKAYTADLIEPASGSWSLLSSGGLNYTFTEYINMPIPNGKVVVNHQSTNPTSTPFISTGTGQVYDVNNTLLFTVNTQTTCPAFIPGTSGCMVHMEVIYLLVTFTANITIMNTSSSSMNGWSLNFKFSGNPPIINLVLGATITQNGQMVTLSNMSSNQTILPNNSVNIEFIGIGLVSNQNPIAYSLNGFPCSTY